LNNLLFLLYALIRIYSFRAWIVKNIVREPGTGRIEMADFRVQNDDKTEAQRHPSTAPFGRELRAERLGAGRRKVKSAG
jgi:hypothetical protein